MTPHGIKELPNGQWVIRNDTHLSAWAEQHGNIISDPHTMKFLDPILDRSHTVWDIGAFIGDHTRHYLNRGKHVVAIEPNPTAFLCLKHNCPEADCRNVAASVAYGRVKFARSPNAGASRISPDGEIEVDCVPLDALHLPDPEFVKIDCEGWELMVLLGLRHMIERAKPIFYVEFNTGALQTNHATPQDLIEFFQHRGYKHFQRRPERAKWEDPQYDVLISP